MLLATLCLSLMQALIKSLTELHTFEIIVFFPPLVIQITEILLQTYFLCQKLSLC